jgi:Flp pilus assembly protein TadB
VKAGLRLAVNSSPEPASNIVVSAGEDLTVAGVVALLVVQPWVAAGIAGTLLVVGAVIVVLLMSRIRRARRRWRSTRRWRSARQ